MGDLLIMSEIKDSLPKLGGEKLGSTDLIWECPACLSENTLVAETEARCIKIFNVPIIPLGKNLSVNCSACLYQADLEALPENLKQICSAIYKNSKTPSRHYYSLILIVMLSSILLYWKYLLPRDYDDYLNDPKIGDLYLMNTGDDKTGYAMVTAVEHYFVYITTFKERPDSIYNLARIYYSVPISAVFTPYSKEQLYNLYEAGIILDIERSDLPEGVNMYEKNAAHYQDRSGTVRAERVPNEPGRTRVKKALPSKKFYNL